MTTKQIKEHHKDFVLAGMAHFTLVNDKTGKRVTYRVVDASRRNKKTEPKTVFFVSFLKGPSYCYIGTIFGKDGHFKYVHSRKSVEPETGCQAAGMVWLLGKLQGTGLPENVTLWHEGRCCCGKRLTDPESIDLGIGPECRKRLGIGRVLAQGVLNV